MVNLVLTPQQVRSAPQPVREWLLSLLATEIGVPPQSESIGDTEGTASLAECGEEEARRILADLGEDYLSTQVFFELGRERWGMTVGQADVCRISLSDLLHHARLVEPAHLMACLDRIATIFRQVRGDGNAVLFAFDQSGGLYVTEATSRSIRSVWRSLVKERQAAADEEQATFVRNSVSGPIGDGYGE
jgi:hypothetical protein